MPALASAGFKVRVNSSPVWRDFPLRLLSLRIDRCFVPINGVVNLSEDGKAVKQEGRRINGSRLAKGSAAGHLARENFDNAATQ